MSATHPYTAEIPRPGYDGRSLAGLFSDLWRETTTLVHDEAELAKADMSEKVSLAVSGARSMAVGGAIAFAGFLVLLLAAVNALAQVLPPENAQWLSPLIVGAVVLVIGFIALSSGRRHLQAENLTPQRTLDSLRRDREVAKEHLT
jgi:hypothetical protein